MAKPEGEGIEKWFNLADVRPLARQLLSEHLRTVRGRLERHRILAVREVHASRVAVRRSRAILELVQPMLQPDRARRLDHRLRQLARVLGPLRDVDVLVERSLGWGLSDRGEAHVEFLYRIGDVRGELASLTKRRIAGTLSAKNFRVRPRLFHGDVISGAAWRANLGNAIRAAVRSLNAPLDEAVGMSSDDLTASQFLEQWHQRRKLCRQLRYQLEMVGSGAGLGPAVQFLQVAQARFGAVQDAAIILTRVEGDLGELMSRRFRDEVLAKERAVLRAEISAAAAWWLKSPGWSRPSAAIAAEFGSAE